MMALADGFDRHDAVTLAEFLRKKETSAVELVNAAIGRIEQLDAELNALVTPMFEQALDESHALVARRGGLPDSPLAGVPIVVKDLVATISGIRHCEGSVFLKD